MPKPKHTTKSIKGPKDKTMKSESSFYLKGRLVNKTSISMLDGESLFKRVPRFHASDSDHQNNRFFFFTKQLLKQFQYKQDQIKSNLGIPYV